MIYDVDEFTEGAADMILRVIKWGDSGEPVCPRCDGCDHYAYKARPVFKCKECGRQHSVLSGSPFESSKLPKSKILKALMLYEISEGKITAQELQRHLGTMYKTAMIMRRKCWEAYLGPGGIMSERSSPLSRGYWQGYNTFFMRDGEIWQANKHGHEKRASWAAAVSSGVCAD